MRCIDLSRVVVLLLCGTGLAHAFPVHTPREMDFGFVVSRGPTVDGHERVRALGPIVEEVRSDDGSTLFAVRPLYSKAWDQPREQMRHDVLWPVYSYRHWEDELFWRLLVVIYENHEVSSEDPRSRFWVVPFVFSGRTSWGERYFSVFPIGGTLHEFLGFDRSYFVLFPLMGYAETDQRRSWNVLWPLINHTDSPTYHATRVVPFWGQSKNDRTGEKRRFVLWPFWTSMQSEDAFGWILFPLFGRAHSPTQETLWVIPPFFRFSKTPDGAEGVAPWPFIRYQSSDDGSRKYFWPFVGTKQAHNIDSGFLMWPFVRWETIHRPQGDLTRFRAFPFMYRMRNASTETPSSYTKVWPLLSYEKDEDAVCFRTLELWPVRNSPGVERNWQRLWTLYQYVARDECKEHELLWGLWRARSDAAGERWRSLFPLVSWGRSPHNGIHSHWALLKGLIGYDHVEDRRSVRLLYFFRLGDKPAPPSTSTHP